MLTKAYIPYGGYYSSPFARWQGSFANDNAIVLGAETAKRWLAEKKWDPGMLDYLYLGTTVGQHYLFYGSTWAAHLMGAGHMPGVTLMQACSTSTTCIYQASIGVETGLYSQPFCLMVDRCSNGPHTIWPNVKGPGGQVESEDWVMDHFGYDPTAKGAMIQTAENVAAEAGLTREECDHVALRRYEQYTDALADDQAFQKRYMFPVEVKVSKKKTNVVAADEGVFPTTAEGLAKLKPVLPDGVHTFGAQTHPADGNAGVLVTTRDQAKELSTDKAFTRVVSDNIRKTDVVARWGGEEFALLLPETSIMIAASTAEKLRKETEQFDFPHVGHITASFGVTQYIEGDTEASLINRADDALYKAKKNGRNRVQMLPPIRSIKLVSSENRLEEKV